MNKTVLAALAAGATLLGAVPAAAAVVNDCGETGRAEFIAEPWAQNTRTFYARDFRIAVVDTGGEPACCSVHLMVLYTARPGDEPEYRACKIVSDRAGGFGFSGIDFRNIKATYDAKRGLLLTVPVTTMALDGATSKPSVIKVRLRDKPSSVTVER
ncbi:MAG: hypothetical protein JSR45_06065 [Proteobacteria bacterium]|nr:hypothetical protein [Pseudomonadota bacterium]